MKQDASQHEQEQDETQNTALSPKEAERAKTSEQRAQDIAYTINHALACTATDFIDPFVGNFTQKMIGKRFSVGCGTHGHDDHHHDHDHGHDAPSGHLGHWWLGEVIGDFGSVPITVGIQHYFPGFMDKLKSGIEPVVGKFFRKGAERATKRWAAGNGIAEGSQEFKDHVEEVYKSEIDHLPQALVWTASSIALNLTTQKLIGNDAPLWQLAAAKATGATISAGLVVGARGFAPGAAEKWDSFTSEKIFLPATKVVGKVIGIDPETVDRMAERENHDKTGKPAQDARSWQDRVSANPQPQQSPSR